MNTPSALAATTPSPRRRRLWPWILTGIIVVPALTLGLAAWNLLRLDRTTTLLRQEAMAATAQPWQTTVQLSAGPVTLGLIRAGLFFVPDANLKRARDALRAVDAVSVGVYRTNTALAAVNPVTFFQETDQRMQRIGWTRLVGVAQRKENVILYVPANKGAAEPDAVCVAVLKGRELIVASARFDPQAVVALVSRLP